MMIKPLQEPAWLEKRRQEMAEGLTVEEIVVRLAKESSGGSSGAKEAPSGSSGAKEAPGSSSGDKEAPGESSSSAA